MTEATQPRMARGTRLPAAVLAAALFALLAFAPYASAAADPVASGSATVTLNNGFFKTLKKHGVKINKIGSATVNGKKARFKVTGGEFDPITGSGTLNLGGGLKFKAGKKKAPVKALVIDTTKKGLFAKVGGKKVKFAKIAGYTYTRAGFGVALTIKKLKLTGTAATQLNKKLGFKRSPKPFQGNRLMGKANAEEQPSTVAIIPGGNTALALSPAALQKLQNVGPNEPGKDGPFSVKLSLISPATILEVGPPPTVGFPISGGSISPTASAGTVQHVGGIKLVQDLEAVGQGETTLTMNNIWIDLTTKTASAEITITNPKNAKANLGPLGRASIADIQLTAVSVDSGNRRISVNGTATLQAVTAETLNAVFITPIEEATAEPQEKFAAGDPLGSFSFTAQTQ
jgi:hypothetical protein